jgi:hypothetical protein
VHVWWADKTLEQYGAAPVQWQDYTTGVVQSGIVPGDHFGVAGNVHVLNQIASALADLESVGMSYPILSILLLRRFDSFDRQADGLLPHRLA